jgi:hypothetical protein
MQNGIRISPHYPRATETLPWTKTLLKMLESTSRPPLNFKMCRVVVRSIMRMSLTVCTRSALSKPVAFYDAFFSFLFESPATLAWQRTRKRHPRPLKAEEGLCGSIEQNPCSAPKDASQALWHALRSSVVKSFKIHIEHKTMNYIRGAGLQGSGRQRPDARARL